MRLLMMTQAVDLDDPMLGFTHQWLNELSHHFDHIHVITRIGGRHSLAKNITLHPYATPTQADNPIRRHLFYQWKLGKLILGNQVDTIFIHMIPKWVILASRYTKIKKIPITLWYTHAAPDPILQQAHSLVTSGLTATRKSYHYYDDKVSAIGHGIDTNIFKPVAHKQKDSLFQILMVGRISSVKRIDFLIEGLAKLKDRLPFSCQIVGASANDEGEKYHKQLQKDIKRFELEPFVHFTGAIPYSEIRPFYYSSDLMINLTEANSFDKTVLEAMACGTLVLTSNPAFFPMLEKHGRFLTLQEQSSQLLADQISTIATLSFFQKSSLQSKLRQEIEENHNLTTLMEKIATTLKKRA